MLPGDSTAGMFVLAGVFAWAAKAALIEPFARACMLLLFSTLTEGQEPLPEWRGRLTRASDRFRVLGERAVGWQPAPPTPAPPPPLPPPLPPGPG